MELEIAKKLSKAVHDWRDAETVSLGSEQDQYEDIIKAKQKHIGLRILMTRYSRKEPLLAKLNQLIPDMVRLAIDDEHNIDYIEIIRERAVSKKQEVCEIEIVEKIDKRPTWVGE